MVGVSLLLTQRERQKKEFLDCIPTIANGLAGVKKNPFLLALSKDIIMPNYTLADSISARIDKLEKYQATIEFMG